MGSVAESIQEYKNALEPYIKPRDQAARIRRILALHLNSCLQGGQHLSGPISLVDLPCTVKPSQETQGLQREYLKALNANLKARKEFEETRCAEIDVSSTSVAKKGTTSDPLQEQIGIVKLKQKKEKLAIIQSYIDLLSQQPAAAPEFLTPDTILKGSPSLPQVPREVVDSFTVDETPPKRDLKELISELEKVVLRTKLLLRREEQLLQVVRDKSSASKGHVSDGAKLHALNLTRNELINWIETELSKASENDDALEEECHDETASTSRQTKNKTLDKASENINSQLLEIHDKYEKYVVARKKLLSLVAERPQPSLKPAIDIIEANSSDTPTSSPSYAHLLTPYFEALLALSREQRGMITNKSHLNVTLAKQIKDACQTLDHLAQESQLLPAHPMPGVSRHKLGLGEDLLSGIQDRLELCGRVKPWVFASDSAKIATLEAVAEKIEEGQLALEGSMRALQEIDHLFGRDIGKDEKSTKEDANNEDIWLATDKPGKGSRKHVEKVKANMPKPGDIWSVLDGKLGLANHDSATKKKGGI
jgi:hypothetical protein